MENQSLKNLFKMQRELDREIVAKHKSATIMEGEVVPKWKFLSLFVEIGECANEWRGFKVWSNDRNPRIRQNVNCNSCEGSGDINWPSSKESLLEGGQPHLYEKCEDCMGSGEEEPRNPLLEETVDCLHFVLSIGNDVGYTLPSELHLESLVAANHHDSTLEQFNSLIGTLSDLNLYIGRESSQEMNVELYESVLLTLIALTEKLEFTWGEVVEAYKRKNKVNHDRQNSGY